jgi:signal transduction histidine kinase
LANEIVIPKTASGIFNATNVDYVLRNLGIDYLVMYGVMTDQCVESAVRDTGIGIRPEDREAIFRPFYQVENGIDRTQEGTGLGLSVSRRLIEMMGGEIWLASAAGEGSTFGFTVPRGTTGGEDG